MPSSLSVSFATSSRAGRKPENQDAVGAHCPTNSSLTNKGITAIVADGVSSSEAAQEASQTSVVSFINDYYSTPDIWTVKRSSSKVLQALNSWLYMQGQNQADPKRKFITTFSAVIFKSATAHILHVGDSRVYRLRQGQLDCLTRDHIANFGSSNALNNAMGLNIHVEVDYQRVDIMTGDVFFLMSDGVYEYVTNKDIIDTQLRYPAEQQSIADTLVELAYANSSHDNLSCVVCTVESMATPHKDEVLEALKYLPIPPDLEPGNKIDDFLIIKELHASSRSQLYLAEDLQTGNHVVIKTPSVNFSDDPKYLKLFAQEEWIGQQSNHQVLMKIYDVSARKKFLYHVCEYVKGQSLRDWMDANPKPSLDDIQYWVEQIATGLRALHRLDIIHQDLKPDNVMIDLDKKVKLIDYGSAYSASKQEGNTLDILQPPGAKNYVAPEYYSGIKISNQADIFSLGVIAYELACGHLPYKVPRGNQFTGKNHTFGPYKNLMNSRPDIPQWFDGTLQQALAINPQNRYTELSEFIYDINHPNPKFVDKTFQPLIESNPVLTWRMIALTLFISNCVFAYLLFKPS